MQSCDNTSAGVLVFREGKLLLIDRAKPPYGYAAPAGHVDDHGTPGDLEEERYRDAAHDELREETGLSASSLTLLGEGRKELACRRGGTWHYWRVYVAEASGEVVLNPDEAVRHIWCDKAQLEALLRGGAIETEHGSVTLEPVWIDWLGELDIVSQF